MVEEGNPHHYFVATQWVSASLLMLTVHHLMQSERCHLFSSVAKVSQITHSISQECAHSAPIMEDNSM
ncbi:UTP23 isoform 4 [Pongo abelii]|uniref:UTP23 isoform 4 n=1 Tax=Pongo abelii TaxID=9601 RepID=A0A2J8X370_PONAB|nr:UTP23 isoform 4 [Pongo abelii]